MKPPLWKHQREAVDRAHELRRYGGIALDVPMAFGKSRTAVTFAEEIEAQRVLIMTPPSPCVEVWEDAIEHWSTRDCVLLSAGSRMIRRVTVRDGEITSTDLRRNPSASLKAEYIERTLETARLDGLPCYVAANYESWIRPQMRKLAYTSGWDLCIADEFHKLKAPFGKASKFAGEVARRIPMRMGLSGTIIPHSPIDVWGEYRFIDPKLFGTSFVAFRARYAVMGGFKNKDVVGFQRQDELAECMAMRTYTAERDALRLPATTFVARRIDLSPTNMRAYRALESVKVALAKEGTITVANAAAEMHGLMQCANGYGKLDDTGERVRLGTDKRDALREILEDVDEPVVCFYLHSGDGDDILDVADGLGLVGGAVRGGRNDMDQWKQGEVDVLAVQIQAGSNAIDLTRSSLGVFYSIGFSNADYEQAKARLVRTTQEADGVRFLHLMARDTIEEAVFACQFERRNIIDGVLQYLKKKQ